MKYRIGIYGPGLNLVHNFYPHSFGQNLVKWPHFTLWRLETVVCAKEEKVKDLVNNKPISAT